MRQLFSSHWCYTLVVPTSHRRHSLTESSEVAEALRDARRLLPDRSDGQRLRELVSLGARALAEREHQERLAHRRTAQRALLVSDSSDDEQAMVLNDLLDSDQ